MTAMPPLSMTPAQPGDETADHGAATGGRLAANTGAVPGAATGPVVFLHCTGTGRLHRHEVVSKSAVAQVVARLAGRTYGGHFRDDYPDKSAEYAGFNILISQERDGGMRVSREPIPPIRDDLRQIIEENK